MSVQGRLAKLQSLLARVQRRANDRARQPTAGLLARPDEASAAPPVWGGAAVASSAALGPDPQATPQPLEHPAASLEGSGVHELTPGFATAEAELGSAPDVEELSEEDLVEMSSDVLESVPPVDDVQLDDTLQTELARQQVPQDELDFEEAFEPPASSRRPRTVPSLDEVLGFPPQDEDFDLQRDVRAMTPPPESGPQEAPMPPDVPRPLAPDFVALLESQPPLSAQVATASYTSFGGVPGPEQLGQTIDLEDPKGPVLELGVSATPSPPTHLLEELEVTLPVGGRYDAGLEFPPDLRNELEGHRPRENAHTLATESDRAHEQPAETSRGLAPDAHSAPPASAELEVQRPALSGINPMVVRAPEAARQPNTFAELLDASIALGVN